MLGNASNPMLAQAEQGIQAKIPQAKQADFQKVIQAGLTIMYSPKLEQQRNANLANSKDPISDASQGASRLVMNLYQQSGKKLTPDLMISASVIFALEYLDLVAKAGKVQITPDMIAQATQKTVEAVLPLFKAPDGSQVLSTDKIQQIGAQLQSQTGQGAPQGAAPAAAPSGGIISNAMQGA